MARAEGKDEQDLSQALSSHVPTHGTSFDARLDLRLLFKALIAATKFHHGHLSFRTPLDEAYKREWDTEQALEIATLYNKKQKIQGKSRSSYIEWWDIPNAEIPPPPLTPKWDDAFVHRRRLHMINSRGFNFDLRSRASEYAELFELDEDDVHDEGGEDDDFFEDHPDLEQPEWYVNWTGESKRTSENGIITYRDLARALSDIKSGKQDSYYELFANATVSFPDEETVRIDVNFEHGS